MRHALEHVRVDQALQQIHVRALQRIAAARWRDAVDHLGIEQSLGLDKSALDQEAHRLPLALGSHRHEGRLAPARLVARFLDAADQLRDVHELAMSLLHERFVHLAQPVVALARAGGGGNDERHDAIDVAQSQIGGFDRVAAHHVGEDRGVDLRHRVLAAEAQQRIGDLACGDLVELGALLLRGHVLGEDAAPLDGE